MPRPCWFQYRTSYDYQLRKLGFWAECIWTRQELALQGIYSEPWTTKKTSKRKRHRRKLAHREAQRGMRAAEQVFSVPELISHILSFLDPKIGSLLSEVSLMWEAQAFHLFRIHVMTAKAEAHHPWVEKEFNIVDYRNHIRSIKCDEGLF